MTDRYLPAVGEYMTPSPCAVAPQESLDRARRLMRRHGVRHLPVMEDSKLVGILSDRDVGLLLSTRAEANVGYAMSSKPYTVHPDMPLNKVVRVMAERKYGSAVVVDRGAVAGIFTTNDALSTLADVLEGKHARASFNGMASRPQRRRTRRVSRESH